MAASSGEGNKGEGNNVEQGAISIEYALLAILVAIALATAFTALEGSISTLYGNVGSGIDALGN